MTGAGARFILAEAAPRRGDKVAAGKCFLCLFGNVIGEPLVKLCGQFSSMQALRQGTQRGVSAIDCAYALSLTYKPIHSFDWLEGRRHQPDERLPTPRQPTWDIRPQQARGTRNQRQDHLPKAHCWLLRLVSRPDMAQLPVPFDQAVWPGDTVSCLPCCFRPAHPAIRNVTASPVTGRSSARHDEGWRYSLWARCDFGPPRERCGGRAGSDLHANDGILAGGHSRRL